VIAEIPLATLTPSFEWSSRAFGGTLDGRMSGNHKQQPTRRQASSPVGKIVIMRAARCVIDVTGLPFGRIYA
jgi:hypothetical protein